MFLENSRYVNLPTIDTTLPSGRAVTALKLRPLPTTAGDPYMVKQNDQLDVLAQQVTSDGTKFWHIADANTALEANTLVAEPGATILQPST